MKNINEIEKAQAYDIVVLGANGGIGSEVVQIALKQGHRVTAILRTPDKLSIEHPMLTAVKGDILDCNNLAHLSHYITNKDVVISAIGKSSLKKTNLYSEGNKNLVDLMNKAGVSRAFFISAEGLEVNPSFPFFIKFATRYILQVLLKNPFADLKRMEAVVKNSELNWTIMRPPSLTNGPFTGNYRIAIDGFLNKGMRISRADLAHFMVTNIFNSHLFKKTVEIGY